MAINLKNTSDVKTDGIKICVYGQAGSGKTRLIPTLPSPIAISAEGGLLSIRDSSTPYVEISNMAELGEVFQWVTESEEGKKFESIALDSITEIAEVVLAAELKIAKDPRQAYGALSDRMTTLIKSFRDIKGRHVYMSCKMAQIQDESGFLLRGPSMPGSKLGPGLSYLFDEMFALRVEKNAEGQSVSFLQTSNDQSYSAKDRSGALNQFEPYEIGLGGCIEKIIGGEA